ncbi:MAG: carbonic anhydrase [Nocardioidaceae bacterium]
MASEFDDLLAANVRYAETFTLSGFDGVAHRGVAIVTCMDSRIDPLGMVGLTPGDAKILRNPGGRLTNAALEALVLGVHLLGVERILVVPHTRCAMANSTEAELRKRISESSGQDAAWTSWSVIPDQDAALRDDVARIRSHPLIPDSVAVGGFRYDVDTGLLARLV